VTSRTIQPVFDRLGVTLSGACAIHCALLPLALTTFPALAGTWFGTDWFNRTMIGLVIPSSTIAFTLGYRRHQNVGVVLLGAVGLSMLILAAWLGDDRLGESRERLLTILGSTILSVGHLRNYLLCGRAHCNA
jgi:MerC mercury resistance protein